MSKTKVSRSAIKLVRDKVRRMPVVDLREVERTAYMEADKRCRKSAKGRRLVARLERAREAEAKATRAHYDYVSAARDKAAAEAVAKARGDSERQQLLAQLEAIELQAALGTCDESTAATLAAILAKATKAAEKEL